VIVLKVLPLPTQSLRAAAIGPRSNIRQGSVTIIEIGCEHKKVQGILLGKIPLMDVGKYFVPSVCSSLGG
jgi:hypothetical protein